MYRFLGFNRVNFVPEGQTVPVMGVKFFFTDDTLSNDDSIGETPFDAFFRDENCENIFHHPVSMLREYLAEYLGCECYLSFSRKGKLESFSIPALKK